MRKNVAGQKISASLVAKADGSAVTTGTTTVYVTVDGGTQATTGAATHKGNGEWSYAPSQAETNGNHVAYTFVNTLAVGVTVNVYPVAYDPTNPTSLGLANLDAAVSTRLATAGYTAPPTAADVWTYATRVLTAGTNIALAKGTGLTGLNDIAATAIVSGGAITTSGGAVSTVTTATNLTNLPAAPTDWLSAAAVSAGAATKIEAAVWAGAPTGPTLADQAAANWAAAPGSIVAGTVVASPSPTTTTLTATVDVVPTVADQFKGRIVIFAADTTTAALRGQATDITASTAPGSGQAGLTFTALTTAPVTGDVFKIL